MPRKPPVRQTFAEMVADVRTSRTRPRVPRIPSSNAIVTGQLMFGGRCWQRRGPDLDLAAALRAVRDAELIVIGQSGGHTITAIADRATAATLLNTRFEGPGGRIAGPDWPEEPTYTASLFDSDEGQLLLYLDTHC